jgi:hypothetical protein
VCTTDEVPGGSWLIGYPVAALILPIVAVSVASKRFLRRRLGSHRGRCRGWISATHSAPELPPGHHSAVHHDRLAGDVGRCLRGE